MCSHGSWCRCLEKRSFLSKVWPQRAPLPSKAAKTWAGESPYASRFLWEPPGCWIIQCVCTIKGSICIGSPKWVPLCVGKLLGRAVLLQPHEASEIVSGKPSGELRLPFLECTFGCSCCEHHPFLPFLLPLRPSEHSPTHVLQATQPSCNL